MIRVKKETYYIYRHIRKDKNEVFYIGLGKTYRVNAKEQEKFYSRAYQKTKRNRFWNFIVDKSEYEVEIMFECDERSLAIEKEIEFIALYGRRDLNKGTLCNLTDGGDGMQNNKQSKETIEKRKKMYAEGKTGLKSLKGGDSPVAKKVVKVETGEIYNSLTEAASSIGINQSVFSAKLSNRNNQVNDTGFKYLDESLNKEHVVKRRDIKVYDYSTGEIIGSVSEASRLYKKDHRSLSRCLLGQYSNDTPLVYYEDYLKGIKPDELYKSKKYKKVINIETEEIYKTISEAIKVSGISKSTLESKLSGRLTNNTPYMLLEEYNKLR